MATIRQRKLAEAIIENASREKPLTKQELVVSSGYTPAQAKAKMHEITESKGVREALNDFGFTEDNAKMVVAEILLKSEAQDKDRLKAAEQVFKVHGTYAPVKNVNVNLNTDNESRGKAKEIIRGYLSDT
jgi:D-alanyl-D-alanine dipeptidase